MLNKYSDSDSDAMLFKKLLSANTHIHQLWNII